MAKTTYKLHSHQKLTSYMKKFSAIEKTLLFEIAGDKLIAKTHTPDKSVVKIGSILMTDVMDPISEKEDVRIGLFAVDNFVASFKHFGENEVKLEINGEQVGADNVATGGSPLRGGLPSPRSVSTHDQNHRPAAFLPLASDQAGQQGACLPPAPVTEARRRRQTAARARQCR